MSDKQKRIDFQCLSKAEKVKVQKKERLEVERVRKFKKEDLGGSKNGKKFSFFFIITSIYKLNMYKVSIFVCQHVYKGLLIFTYIYIMNASLI